MKVWVLKITEEQYCDDYHIEEFKGIFLLKEKNLKTLNNILNSDEFFQINIDGLLEEQKQKLIEYDYVRNDSLFYSLYQEEVI